MEQSSSGGDHSDPSEGAAGLSVDLHLVTLFIPTTRSYQVGEVLMLKLTARGALELRAMGRVVSVRDPAPVQAGSEVGGVHVQLLDVRPLEQQPPSVAFRSVRPPSFAPDGAQLCVLVVDDDPTLRARTAELMRAEGYEVLEAANGAEALSAAKGQTLAAVVTDVTMPVMDGWQLVRLLRARAEFADVPVLFHTSLDTEAERLRGYSLGVDDYIDKPAEPQDLAERVERALTRRRFDRGEPGTAPLLRGDLAHVALATLLSLLEMEERTGVLWLRSAQAHAEVDLCQGKVMAARVTPPAGESGDLERMFRLLDWSEGEFELNRADVEVAERQGLSVTHILLQHAQRRDEAGR